MTPSDPGVADMVKKLQRRFAEADGEEAQPARPEEQTAQPVPKRSGPARAARQQAGAHEDERVAPAQRNRRHWVAVCYDIADDRRRTKVMKTLEGYGKRVQYSVFECEVKPADLDKLKARLKALIQNEQDDVRFYFLCEGCQGKVTLLGRAEMHRQRPTLVI